MCAVSDWSYIKQIQPELCANTFFIECSKGPGRMVGPFGKANSVANVYRGELFGLMQVHLLLLAVQQTAPELDGEITIYSDCLATLGQVSLLLPERIPSQCKHLDILKNILVSCSGLMMFQRDICHIVAHKDDSKDFHLLDRLAQLNSAVDACAMREILKAYIMALLWQQRFLL
jgi:hypothetical protein